MSGFAGANPNVAQGTLNRVRASVQWPDFGALNVTASYLGPEGISLAFEGDATTIIPTMTGTVTSPEPFQPVLLTMNLLRTQGLANAYEQQRQANSVLGSCTVRPDAATLYPYNLQNCAIINIGELRFAGRDAGFVVTIRGYLPVNSSLFS